MSLATFWPILSKTHLVSLITCQVCVYLLLLLHCLQGDQMSFFNISRHVYLIILGHILEVLWHYIKGHKTTSYILYYYLNFFIRKLRPNLIDRIDSRSDHSIRYVNMVNFYNDGGNLILRSKIPCETVPTYNIQTLKKYFLAFIFLKYAQWQCIVSYDKSTAMYKFL
jgi:hypothetical protein